MTRITATVAREVVQLVRRQAKMEVRQMRYFLAVAEALHFRHASETLHLSQPALSLQIQQLEEELGVKLLSRSTRNVRLTRAGEALAARIRTILSNIDDAVNDTRRIAKGLELPLSISYVSTALAGMLPRALRAMQLDKPGIEFELHDCRPKEQITRLLQETTDIGFMHVKIEDNQLLFKLVQKYELVAALPADMNLEGPVDLKELSHCTVIMPSPWGVTSFGAYNHVQRAYQLAGVEPHNVIHATINGGLRLVASGVGISIVPAPGEQAEIAGVIFRPLLKPPPPIDLIAVWNRNSKASLLHRFLEILDEVREVSQAEDCTLAGACYRGA